ncbi:hypothetical protein GPECTOR_42g788 [Gonium pectorale]|uniref:Uncharacterized protein n=1 Tax=Gonium pectorale TaxID=33097 RepID=A0A150G9Q4_GONPE|nr:hypothetical protein GPECTOR_42g788 [Gonium pectorale]|eukprot:KXZ46577.1 hypothetical protein GPECTOR_42g788 [Gonium pectorale]
MDTAPQDQDHAEEFKKLTTSQQQQLLKKLNIDYKILSRALNEEKDPDNEDPDKPLIQDLTLALADYRARIAVLEKILS